MPTFRLNIVFSGIDFDDDDVFERLAELPDILWRGQGDYALASATIEAPSALQAADLVTEQVAARLPSAHPERLDEDLVAIPDIASRVGVTREAVRHWANGTRHTNFPLPSGIVGDGIKVWAWSDINRWLQENLNLGEAAEFPSAYDAALINLCFADPSRREHVPAVAAATWQETVSTSSQDSVIETVSTSAESGALGSLQGATRWVRRELHHVGFSLIDAVHAA